MKFSVFDSNWLVFVCCSKLSWFGTNSIWCDTQLLITFISWPIYYMFSEHSAAMSWFPNKCHPYAQAVTPFSLVRPPEDDDDKNNCKTECNNEMRAPCDLIHLNVFVCVLRAQRNAEHWFFVLWYVRTDAVWLLTDLAACQPFFAVGVQTDFRRVSQCPREFVVFIVNWILYGCGNAVEKKRKDQRIHDIPIVRVGRIFSFAPCRMA